MTDRTLDQFLRACLDAHPDGEVDIEWRDCDLARLGVGFFARAAERATELCRPGQRVAHTLWADIAPVDEDWADLLAGYGFRVVASVDGSLALGQGIGPSGFERDESARFRDGWETLQKRGVDLTARCEIHAGNVEHPLRVYHYLRDDLATTAIRFHPLVHPSADRSEDRGTVTPERWGDFLVAVFDEWREGDTGNVWVQQIESVFGNRLGDYGLCVHSPVCGQLPAVTHTGDVYSCERYLDQGHQLGSVTTQGFVEMLTSPPQWAFGAAKRSELTLACRTCPVLWACWGGCPRERTGRSSLDEPNHSQLCAGYRRFFEHAAPIVEAWVTGEPSGSEP